MFLAGYLRRMLGVCWSEENNNASKLSMVVQPAFTVMEREVHMERLQGMQRVPKWWSDDEAKQQGRRMQIVVQHAPTAVERQVHVELLQRVYFVPRSVRS